MTHASGLLKTLHVEGFGLIEKTAVELGSGLNAFTGETGSGKSMVIDALGFVFGGRADIGLVRAGSAKAAAFAELEASPTAHAWLADNGYQSDEDELVVAREMSAQGRSSARINGKPATAAQLRELGDLLLDVVGQHDHQQLLQPPRHLDMLDAFAGDAASALREAIADGVAERARLREVITGLRADDAAAARRIADARYAADEIEAARLEPGEIDALKTRRAILANAARIVAALADAARALDDAEAGAVAQLGRASAALDGIGGYGAQFRELAAQTSGLQSAVQDVAQSVSAAVEDDLGDPEELERVEERLALLERLQRKYGETIEEIVAAGARFREEADRLEHRDEELASSERALAACEAALTKDAARLTKLRRAAGERLSARVAEELAAAGMKGAMFRCAVTDRPDEIGASGADRVEFFASLNPNEPDRSIAKAASGGELSRLLLALKMAFSDVDPHPVVVLDEIDAGIGGAAARVVGARIAELSRHAQVLCVTHLAQIAGYADRHIVLSKHKKGDRVIVAATALESRDEVRREIARMLSGDLAGSEALDHAEALLRATRLED